MKTKIAPILLATVLACFSVMLYAQSKTPASQPIKKTRSVSEVRKFVNEQGQAPPSWWDKTPIRHPRSLDLAGTNPTKRWNAQQNLPQWVISVYRTPQQWKPAAKTLALAIEERKKNNPSGLAQAYELAGRIYSRLIGDYARGAYYFEQALKASKKQPAYVPVELANCYFQLGSKPLALMTLRKYKMDRRGFPETAYLYYRMGEKTKAVNIAKALLKARAGDGYVILGNLYRMDGDYAKATAAYAQAAKQSSGRRNLGQRRANESLKALEGLHKPIDVKTIKDGDYPGGANGYRGAVHVTVTVKDGKIEAVKVGDNREDWPLRALVETPKRMVDLQKLDVDAVSGATTTYDAVVNAATNALKKAK